ncbi:glutamate synthase large subunit [Alkaliphilus peptidifermentans]|uniref:Glutamate synthase (NADPH/NADH) large chain n=1 Tax=Alkaliphilus peptidifermentans DSM 18978 TaxID=1120976 RepID=A0A1G5FV94_9FIRM|nr:glutamate synthase large subunit [Alkaliphilus peptidifermentans]SCY43071.1 glutamate synthase (NADPH/NADH) large chain [Alkaliphilus peptidifermentans DSM 18978]
MNTNMYPERQGLYNPSMEKDSCGVGFIVNINGYRTHEILHQGLQILKNLSHRGAVGADSATGDGSGISIQIPHEFLKKEANKINITLPNMGDYAVGMIFLPREPNARLFCEGVLERIIREEGQSLLGWREVPINEDACGESARATRPVVAQIFIDRRGQSLDAFERKLFILRKQVQNIIMKKNKPYTDGFYICSLSTATVVYKGQILGHKLDEFYVDLLDARVKTSIALIHERYSTNTFPSWKLAQPFRYIAHNGEINTIRGNINWMNAREGVMHSNLFGEEYTKILPIIEAGGSDSASLDNALEYFVKNQHSVENTMMMLIPEAWQNDMYMDKEKRSFYEYHARVMEPWDGPATIAFTDGIKVGVTVDRNGLRPARYIITKDDMVIMASEVGVLDIPPEKILEKGCLQPGKILLVNTKEGRIVSDNEIKALASTRKPFREWVERNRMTMKDIEASHETKVMSQEVLHRNQLVFGYTTEEINKVIAYMAKNAKEPIGSMGVETPIAILSQKPQMIFNYFKQKFAQVTNPPIDPIREAGVMSLVQFIGSHGRLLDKVETEVDNKYIKLQHPILKNSQLEYIRRLNTKDFKAITIPIVFQADHIDNGLREALDYLCKRAEENVKLGYNIIILSDRNIDMYNAPIPSLLALGAVHHHLVRTKQRTSVDIIMETGDARDAMHMALLVGFGAKAINPYMAFETISHIVENNKKEKKNISLEDAINNYSKAICAGLLKIISRMGISTLQSYSGAQIFEAIGLNQRIIDKYFTDTPAVLSGIGLEDISKGILGRQFSAYHLLGKVDVGGEIVWHKEGEFHTLNPEVVKKLRGASKNKSLKIYNEYADMVNNEAEKTATIRGLLNFKKRNSISIEEVETVESIIKRFRISAMSFGSLSTEAHETLAIAGNRIGLATNCGEGGEDPSRYDMQLDKNLKSKVKQVASGRFGVTTNYLINCNEIEIKMAQGAKPGEGGHLPGDKVTAEIARVRHSAPGIDLISPPPHHDIYSIEDLSQLIFDLKNVNPKAKIGVKLVSQIGVGTVVAGVAKAYADFVMVSGHDGGTGAAPLSSMKYVGLPWELGIAEAQQTLLLNNLRSRIKLQVDGKMKTGRDVIIAALLGAEEYGFATTPLIACGCKMCRQCHLNMCPAGIATQEYALRQKFDGKPEDLINYFYFVAMEIRTIMAELGFKTIEEMIGRVDVLEVQHLDKDTHIDYDLSAILYKPELPSRIEGRCTINQRHNIESILDRKIICDSKETLKSGKSIEHMLKIRNTDRSFGSMLSGEIALRYGDAGLPDDTIKIFLEGSAGQSFGAFAIKGLTLVLEGDANDYLGKGLSGGKIIVIPPKMATYDSSENIIAGNTLLYGATGGESYIAGRVGQRFCVRNSGAIAIVEGIGDHGCEYMTGGIAVVLGSIGKNFGAGMSGGVAYVLNEDNDFKDKFNNEMIEVECLNNREEIKSLQKLITKHYVNTQSNKAKDILNNWNFYGNKFLKICSPFYSSEMECIG